MQSHINVGYGDDVTIFDLATLVAKVVGYIGEIKFDKDKPDGAPQKLMDSGLLSKLGWSATISLEQGLVNAYLDFIKPNQTTHSAL